MKDILITGAAGKIGYELLKVLIDSKYSITALDLPSEESKQKLGKVSAKIKIIYGDVEDEKLIVDLIQKNDIVIDFAGIMPPLANLNEELTNRTNYIGCKNIVDAINSVNPNCLYIYPSFISIYGPTDNKHTELSVNSETNDPDDYYSISLIRSENYIKENVKNFIIFRMPIVLTKFNYYVKYMRLNRTFDFITVNNFIDIIIQSLENKKLYRKTFNISGFKAKSDTFIEKRYKYTGRINIIRRNLYFGEYKDSNIINNYIDISYDTINKYFKQFKHPNYILKILNLPKYLIFRGMKKRRKKL